MVSDRARQLLAVERTRIEQALSASIAKVRKRLPIASSLDEKGSSPTECNSSLG